MVARLIIGTSRYEHTSPVLAYLHWLPANFHGQLKVLVTTYKALNALGHQYVVEDLSQKIATHPTCSLESLMLKIVALKETKRANIRNQVF